MSKNYPPHRREGAKARSWVGMRNAGMANSEEEEVPPEPATFLFHPQIHGDFHRFLQTDCLLHLPGSHAGLQAIGKLL